MSGSNGAQTGSDTLHKQLFIECKLRAKSPVHCLFAQVEKSAAKEGKTPVVALQQKHCSGFLLVCRPEDLHVLASYAKDIDRLPESDP